MMDNKSQFTGGIGSYIWLRIVCAILSIITIGLYTPWAICKTYRWRIGNKIIDGQRITFDGKGGQLIGQWIKWCLLSLITIGIYALFIPVKLERWKTEKTHFAQ